MCKLSCNFKFLYNPSCQQIVPPTRRPAVGAEKQKKMLTIAQKVDLLDMLKEGKSYAATSRHYGIKESSVRSTKKEENDIKTTAAINFNKDAKRVKGYNCQ